MYQTAYQTEILGIIPAISASAPRRPTSGPVAGSWPGLPHGRTGRESPRQGERGAHVGAGIRDTLSKLRTVRSFERVSGIQAPHAAHVRPVAGLPQSVDQGEAAMI